MELVRFVTCYLSTAELAVDPYTLSFGDQRVQIESLRTPDDSKLARLSLVAHVPLDQLPAKSEQGLIVVPDNSLRSAEANIEHVANLYSVAENCSRRLSSPYPMLAFRPANEVERSYLIDSAGIKPISFTIPKIAYWVDLTDDSVLEAISDRRDGVSLLAEALAQAHPSGRYRELVRFFELAFQLPFTQLRKRLTQFLQGANLGYTREEIQNWISKRHPATHADGRKTTEIILESDVRSLVPRMEQAAYDTLLNKRTWHDSSRERRVAWRPDAATTSPTGNSIQAVRGGRLVLSLTVFDFVGSYHYDPHVSINPLPDELWSEWSEFDHSDSAPV